MRTITAKTLVWLHDRPHDAGAKFAVVDKPDPAAKDPAQIDPGTAALWLQQQKAGEEPVAATGRRP